MICSKNQKRHHHNGNVFRLNILMLIKIVFIHDTHVSRPIVSNHYCAALSTVVGAVVGVALTGTAKYF